MMAGAKQPKEPTDDLAAALAHIDQLESEARRLAEREKTLGLQLLGQRITVEELTEAGGRAIAGVDDVKSNIQLTPSWAQSLAEARATVDLITAAYGRLREERKAVITAYRRALCEPPRHQAAAARAQADRLDAESAPHLAALRGLQGCEYAPAEPMPQGPSYGMGGALLVITRPLPKSFLLRDEAQGLERTATQRELEADRVPMNGYVEAASVDGLIDGIFADAVRLGPRIPDVVDWARQAEDRERLRLREWHRRYPNAAEEAAAMRAQGPSYDQVSRVPVELPPAPDAPMSYMLGWREGKIDEAASRAQARPRAAEPAELESQRVRAKAT